MLSRSMMRAHLAAAIVVIAMFVILLGVPIVIDDVRLAVPILSLAMVYAASWLAIGWSLRHVPAIPKKSAARA